MAPQGVGQKKKTKLTVELSIPNIGGVVKFRFLSDYFLAIFSEFGPF